MLKGASTLLNADVSHALRAMGHCDDLIVADIPFPFDSIARQTRLGALLRINNVTAAKSIEAVLSVYPPDTFVDDAACREIVGSPDDVPPILPEPSRPSKQLAANPGRRFPSNLMPSTNGETRLHVIQFYGCFAFRKGVIPTDGK